MMSAALQYQNASVRHLAWLCQAPQLMTGNRCFHPTEHLPTDWQARLDAWDRALHSAPESLREPAPGRLGLYVERLYRCLMTDLLGWELLAHNVQIAGAGRTLGELDFVLRCPHTGEVEHHEIAVKFYLGYRAMPDIEPLWYGPNTSDRLDLKSARLLNHQARMIERPETVAVLDTIGLPRPGKAKIFMPGYLFYPDDQTLRAPSDVPDAHARGRWQYASQVQPQDIDGWAHLRKPHWLGPWVQSGPPDPEAARERLAQVQATGTPRLFASLEQIPYTYQWVEAQRIFVVPDHWPGV